MAEKAVEQQVYELSISKLDLEDLISSIVDNIGNTNSEVEMMRTPEYQSALGAIHKAERKAKEISKTMSQSMEKVEKYMEILQAEEKELEEEVRKKQEEQASSQASDGDSDDDVTIIDATFEPRKQPAALAVKRPSFPLAAKQSSQPQEQAQLVESQGQQFILQGGAMTPVSMVVGGTPVSVTDGNPPTMANLRAALTNAIQRQVSQPAITQPATQTKQQMIVISPPSDKPIIQLASKPRPLMATQSTSTPASLERASTPIQWKEIVVGSKVLAKKVNDIWYSGVVTEIQKPANAQNPGQYKYRVKFDGKGMKVFSGHHIAYRQPVNCFLKVGTRVAALYRDDESAVGSSYYAGIVAEAPSLKNNKRYLVFFDDGYAQYCLAKELHKVYYQSENVWEDIHPDSQEFIKEYLKQYPERPMVRLLPSQIVKTEWNGRWWTAKVMQVDASLVKMYFQADKRTEWIYRGSTRLEPLFKALANAEAIKAAGSAKGRRLNLDTKGQKRPTVEYTRGTSEDHAKKDRKASKDEKRHTARKSTGGVPSRHPKTPRSLTAERDCADASVAGWEAPWLKINSRRQPTQQSKLAESSPQRFEASSISSNKQGRDMASVLQERLAIAAEQGECVDEGEALGQRLDTMIDVKDKVRKKFVPHVCCNACVKEGEEDRDKHNGKNPLLIPLLCSWERQVCKMRPGGRRCVIYRAPCARRLRTIEELDEYLALTDSQLFIDYFCFDPWLHVHTEFVPVKTFCDIKDLSYGKENVPISCVNGIDRQYPEYVEYSSYRIPSKGVKILLDEDFLQCCDCTDNCRDRSKCACQQLTVENTTWIGERDPKAGYHHRRLIEPIFTGVVECNSRCKCDSRCRNRVAQNGLSCRLQVFKTEKRGWGLRCLNDIPKGGFICIYAGQLLTDTGANDDGKQYGDEYLAELDFIEVVERQKEGYESDVEEPQSDGGIEKDNAEEDDDEDDEESHDGRGDVSSDSDFEASGSGSKLVTEKVHETRRRKKQEDAGSETDSKDVKKEEESEKKIQKMEEEGPIEVPDDDDEEITSAGARKKEEAVEVDDELPDLVKREENLEEKETEVKKEEMAPPKEQPVKKEKIIGESESQLAHRARKSTGGSRFKNLPDPKKAQSGPPVNEEDEKHRVGTRSYFKDATSCYIMDAKSMGNIGRYLNHSCSPNVFVQNIFVDTHDLRFPWVAFFAGQYIRAGTELTWDYNYEVGSVPDKVLYCYCGSPMCRGRLL